MRKPWFLREPGRLEQIRADLVEHFPHLHPYPRDRDVLIRGTFPVLADGGELDRFLLEIVLLDDYPTSIPVVYEVGGRIPRTKERHVNPDGAACLFLPDERWWVWPPGSSFLEFLTGPLHNYYLGQARVDRGLSWPFGTRDHGVDGIYRFYEDILGTSDREAIERYLELFAKESCKGHWDCPCGSGRRLRDCHVDLVRELKSKIPCATARVTLEKYLKKPVERGRKRGVIVGSRKR